MEQTDNLAFGCCFHNGCLYKFKARNSA
jgi:hypothetical protein